MLFAEVMDKELTLTFLWSYFTGVGFVGFLFGFVRWWLCVAIVPFIAILAFFQISELNDPFVGPDILAEAGAGYVLQSYAAISSGVVLPILGILTAAIWRLKSASQTDSQ